MPSVTRELKAAWEEADRNTAAKQRADGAVGDESIPEFCDEALTLAFSERHADDLRYCDAFGRWYQWDGGRWSPDEKRCVFTLARAHCRNKAAEAMAAFRNDKTADKIASAKTVAAVVNLARYDPRHATAHADWDSDPWALNTPGGTVDLRTGSLCPHDRRDLHSKTTAVAPTPAGTDCPLWTAFINRIMADDGDLTRFLQRLMGYALTGLTTEHILAFLYGTGANGKGVFLNTLAAILGDYATVSPMETFTDSSNDRHPTELAMLKGARLVAAQETEEGRRWAESKIKALTGGDPITARFMRQDFFTFVPQFTLLVAGNHKPGLRNFGEAIRRRLNLVPLAVTIPPEERDPQLPDKLKAEWPAILRWAIDGCLEWQRIGLAQPHAVVAATEEYFLEEDSLTQWVDDSIVIDPLNFESSSDLFASWRIWAERAGLAPGTQRAFVQTLQNHGYQPLRRNKSRGFIGIRLSALTTPMIGGMGSDAW